MVLTDVTAKPDSIKLSANKISINVTPGVYGDFTTETLHVTFKVTGTTAYKVKTPRSQQFTIKNDASKKITIEFTKVTANTTIVDFWLSVTAYFAKDTSNKLSSSILVKV